MTSVSRWLSVAVAFSAVDELDAEWVWQDRIPVAELTILAGKGGGGKGLLTADLAARITRGEPLPGDDDDGERRPASVIMVAAEDSSQVVTVGRLKAAGADLSRVHDLSMPGGMPFDLGEHIPVLREAIRELGDCRLVIIDPLAAVSPVPLQSVAKVRGLFRPLQAIAWETGTAILITHHVTKAGVVAGSQAIRDGVRCVLTVEADDDDPEVRAVAVAKTNMGSDKVPALRYSVVTDEATGLPHVLYLPAAGDVPESAQAQLSVALSRAGGSALSPQQLAAATGLPYATVRGTVRRMVTAGLAVSPARGLYAAPGTPGKDGAK